MSSFLDHPIYRAMDPKLGWVTCHLLMPVRMFGRTSFQLRYVWLIIMRAASEASALSHFLFVFMHHVQILLLILVLPKLQH